MKNNIIILSLIAILVVGGFVLWSSMLKNNTASLNNAGESEITVLKSPTCGCCAVYADYLKQQGRKVKVEDVKDTLSVKEKYQIPQELESCHTSVVGNYFVEGHIPVAAIDKLLAEKPDILGIALPGMPQGSPGMGGQKTEEFKIQALLKDGSIKEFMSL